MGRTALHLDRENQDALRLHTHLHVGGLAAHHQIGAQPIGHKHL